MYNILDADDRDSLFNSLSTKIKKSAHRACDDKEAIELQNNLNEVRSVCIGVIRELIALPEDSLPAVDKKRFLTRLLTLHLRAYEQSEYKKIGGDRTIATQQLSHPYVGSAVLAELKPIFTDAEVAALQKIVVSPKIKSPLASAGAGIAPITTSPTKTKEDERSTLSTPSSDAVSGVKRKRSQADDGAAPTLLLSNLKKPAETPTSPPSKRKPKAAPPSYYRHSYTLYAEIALDPSLRHSTSSVKITAGRKALITRLDEEIEASINLGDKFIDERNFKRAQNCYDDALSCLLVKLEELHDDEYQIDDLEQILEFLIGKLLLSGKITSVDEFAALHPRQRTILYHDLVDTLLIDAESKKILHEKIIDYTGYKLQPIIQSLHTTIAPSMLNKAHEMIAAAAPDLYALPLDKIIKLALDAYITPSVSDDTTKTYYGIAILKLLSSNSIQGPPDLLSTLIKDLFTFQQSFSIPSSYLLSDNITAMLDCLEPVSLVVVDEPFVLYFSRGWLRTLIEQRLTTPHPFADYALKGRTAAADVDEAACIIKELNHPAT